VLRDAENAGKISSLHVSDEKFGGIFFVDTGGFLG